jgi:copper chaperone CopZ
MTVVKTPDEMTVQVEGMSCAGCEQRIGTALRRLDGVRDVTADHLSGRVRVRFDPDTTGPDAVRDRIELAGYTVRGDEREESRR